MKQYIAAPGKVIDAQFIDLARRRTLPFLKHGMHYSLEHLMQEAYLQGIRDAIASGEHEVKGEV